MTFSAIARSVLRQKTIGIISSFYSQTLIYCLVMALCIPVSRIHNRYKKIA